MSYSQILVEAVYCYVEAAVHLLSKAIQVEQSLGTHRSPADYFAGDDHPPAPHLETFSQSMDNHLAEKSCIRVLGPDDI